MATGSLCETLSVNVTTWRLGYLRLETFTNLTKLENPMKLMPDISPEEKVFMVVLLALLVWLIFLI
jgi:hypothetical protein